MRSAAARRVAGAEDVYAGENGGVRRTAGEGRGSRRGGDAWTAADEAMLRRIARSSMDRLAAFLDGSGSGRPPAPGPATADDMTVAAAGDAARPAALAAALAMADARP